jgi:hypothetical protein
MTENTEADAIMALHKQVLVETGWECSTDSPPALKRAADTFRAEVERVHAEIRSLRNAACFEQERAENAERDNEALRSLLKEAQNALLDYVERLEKQGGMMNYGRSVLARIDDALAKGDSE